MNGTLAIGEGGRNVSGIWHISWLGIVGRLFAAAVLGGAVGLERGWKNNWISFRMHLLVSMGAALLVILSVYGFGGQQVDPNNHPQNPNAEPNLLADPARLVAQAVSGIGFLGTGLILVRRGAVIGTTTAASVWVVCAIGLCAGAGFYWCAAAATVIVLLSLTALKTIEDYIVRKNRP